MKIVLIALCSAIATNALAATSPAAPTPTTTTTEAPAPAEPPKDLGLRIGAKAGLAIPTSKLGATPVFGIDAEYRLPMLDRLLGIAAEFAYSAPSLSGSSSDPATGSYDYALDTRVTSFALEAIARRAFDRIEPYGGIGYSIVLLHAQTSAFATKTTESQTRAGVQVRGGAGYRLGPGHVFAEARYQFAHFDFESTGSSSAGTFDLLGGYRFAF